MKTISVGALRQNPTQALADVQAGQTYVVTRHRQAVARLAPVDGPGPTGRQVAEFTARWRGEHDDVTVGFTAQWLESMRENLQADDPWQR
ncbi:MAG: type II toxin-antitoxin system Phd/YefM family antitoxin [Micrococcales bacterium]|nr:type II toxin-antitoxin system Phd/YefM family antitoxin [Micrococcales bacterium]